MTDAEQQLAPSEQCPHCGSPQRQVHRRPLSATRAPWALYECGNATNGRGEPYACGRIADLRKSLGAIYLSARLHTDPLPHIIECVEQALGTEHGLHTQEVESTHEQSMESIRANVADDQGSRDRPSDPAARLGGVLDSRLPLDGLHANDQDGAS